MPHLRLTRARSTKSTRPGTYLSMYNLQVLYSPHGKVVQLPLVSTPTGRLNRSAWCSDDWVRIDGLVERHGGGVLHGQTWTESGLAQVGEALGGCQADYQINNRPDTRKLRHKALGQERAWWLCRE
jgi:hypothetical protein